MPGTRPGMTTFGVRRYFKIKRPPISCSTISALPPVAPFSRMRYICATAQIQGMKSLPFAAIRGD
jgi:hypothetical protein